MEKIQVALIGAGGRGIETFGGYALQNPADIQFVAVAEPDATRRTRFAALHQIPPVRQFASWEDLLEKPQLCPGIIIATMDRLHYAPTLAALQAGYDILLEKPMSTDPLECIRLAETAEAAGRLLMICHVLRYVPFFSVLKRLLDEGFIGKLVSIQHNENVGYFHQAHSFVRGNWRNSQLSSPMILAKSCHDLDILVWLVGQRCQRVASFGSLSLFCPENAPPGSTNRCLDGCAVERECAFSARRIYLEEHPDWLDFLVPGGTPEEQRQAVHDSPYGRCVYRCDNDVVDHQVVSLEFATGITAAFSMCAFTQEINRTIKLMGTDGQIRGDLEKNEIEVYKFSTLERMVIHTPAGLAGHGGGDAGIMHDFVSLLRPDRVAQRAHALTSASASVESHLIAFAAELARHEKRVVEMDAYARSLTG